MGLNAHAIVRRLKLVLVALAKRGVVAEIACATRPSSAKPGIELWKWVLQTNAPVPVLLDHSLMIGDSTDDEQFACRVEIPFVRVS